MIVIAPPAVARAADFAAGLDDRIAGLGGVRLQVEIALAAPAELPQRVVDLGCRVLAVEAGAERLRHFVERFSCDILIVR